MTATVTATATPKLTTRQALLNAAKTLPQPFTEAELIVAAWQANPRMFGLRGFEDKHPDNNHARTYIVGERGLVAGGMLTKVAPLTYTVTGATSRPRLFPKHRKELERLLRSDAVHTRRLGATPHRRAAEEFVTPLARETITLLRASVDVKQHDNYIPSREVADSLWQCLADCDKALEKSAK